MRLLLMILACALVPASGGCARPEPVPGGAVAGAAPRADPPSHYEEGTWLRVCVLSAGHLREVEVRYDVTTGDSATAQGRPFSEAYPVDSSYAAVHRWFVEGEMLPIAGREFPLEKYGLPRLIRVHEVERFGVYRGVPVFVEAGTAASVPDVVYLPVRPGCEFQPYQQAYTVGAVRGR